MNVVGLDPPSGDFIGDVQRRLEAHSPASVEIPGYRAAAVLVPLLLKGAEPYILFTQRSQEVPTHKGHVSFPGGAVETSDPGLAAAALRETHEEIGIAPEQVRILGRLDDGVSNTARFVIAPFVGLVPDGAARLTSDREVARILEIPLAYLLDSGNRRPDARTNNWRYPWQDAEIWGATARILNGFLNIMGLADPFAENIRA